MQFTMSHKAAENEKKGITEKILIAANWYNDEMCCHVHKANNIETGFIVCGYRHHHCINTFAQMVGFPYSKRDRQLRNTEVQGFLTSLNRFVTRKEAFIIAKEANQIINLDKTRDNELYSEDLY